ncbi:MGH1-like glycoside hydrolase domain-containing protein [Halobaculum sp. EA56]|uniref:MGH1-like glycoside hydrolase domain-containing protein n=1 Tax=Halobaculum sp. EA56 TaxID=3421648 RepID=UPI003EB9069B
MKRDSTVVAGSTFLVTDGDGRPTRAHDGFYHRDVRHLDRYELSVADGLETLDVAEPRPGERLLHLGTPLHAGARGRHVARRQFVSDGLYELVSVSNLDDERAEVTVTLSLGTRFDDLFEVRGMGSAVDRSIEATTTDRGLSFRYAPTDLAYERTVGVAVGGDAAVSATARGGDRADGTVEATVDLPPGETRTLPLAVAVDGVDDAGSAVADARAAVRDRVRGWRADASLPTRGDGWDDVLRESRENLLELRQETEHGPILSAGVPWFATAFGRDSLIAAYQAMPLSTGIAKGTCRYLAAHRATETDSEREAEPGKILHEVRHGELAARGLVPHRPYYGTIDATPLFVVVVHEVWRRTGDDAFLRDLWPAVSAALGWLERSGVGDGGFLTYPVDDDDGDGRLRHVSWKDSNDGIVYPDGAHPSGDLAAAEVQGYAYDALRRGADIANEVGERDRAGVLERTAESLRQRFDARFWLSDEEFYAVAVDGDGTPIPSVTTNPGHCLWSGIVPEERADAVVDRLLAPDMFTGWGVRTFAASHGAFNPQSYHLGSVWPHDNSLVALGMARYGRTDGAERIAEGLVAAARTRGNDRLPELFAGFDRERTDVPVTYGEACEPQAWAAAAPLACARAVDGDVGEAGRPRGKP